MRVSLPLPRLLMMRMRSVIRGEEAAGTGKRDNHHPAMICVSRILWNTPQLQLQCATTGTDAGSVPTRIPCDRSSSSSPRVIHWMSAEAQADFNLGQLGRER